MRDPDSLFADLRKTLSESGALGDALRNEVSLALSRIAVFAGTAARATEIQNLALDLSQWRK